MLKILYIIDCGVHKKVYGANCSIGCCENYERNK